MRLLRRIQRHGVIGTLKLVPVNLRYLYRYRRHWALSAIRARRRDRRLGRDFDRRYGTKTSGIVPREALGATGDNAAAATWYEPTPIAGFDAIMRFLPREIAEYRFIDYGSGRGRVLLLASRYPFKEIIGIEFSERLHRDAEANLRKFLPPERVCYNAKSLLMDAELFTPPPGPTIFFLFNPFGHNLVETVLKRIEDVHCKDNSALYLFYYYPKHRDLLLKSPFWSKLASEGEWSVFMRRSAAETAARAECLGSQGEEALRTVSPQ